MIDADQAVRISAYQAADHDHVVLFQEQLWAAGLSRNSAYLRWKYQRNPYLDDRYLVLGRLGEEVVGMVGAFGACWELAGGQRVMLPCLADALVAPAQRGGSLFARLVNAVSDRLRRDDVPWLLDFGNGEAASALRLRGWRSMGPWGVVRAPRRRSIPADHSWPARPTQLVRGRRTGLPVLASSTIDAAAVATLANRWTATTPDRCRHVFDCEYLDWWLANPLARYRFLSVGTDQIAGYLIVHHPLDPDRPGPAGTILDCVALEDAIWTDLMEVAAEYLPGKELIMWAREISPKRLSAIADLGYRIDQPTGRLTRDWALPDLLLQRTGAVPVTAAIAGLDDADAWELRAVCGRSWR